MTSIKKPQKQNKPVKLRWEFNINYSFQFNSLKCSAAAVNHIGKVHYLLPNEHEIMRRKEKICYDTWHQDGKSQEIKTEVDM